MRDFRDAKAMAQTLRDSLTTKAVTISHSESLELVSRVLGISDWNTLSALLQADRHETGTSIPKRGAGAISYPAIHCGTSFPSRRCASRFLWDARRPCAPSTMRSNASGKWCWLFKKRKPLTSLDLPMFTRSA